MAFLSSIVLRRIARAAPGRFARTGAAFAALVLAVALRAGQAPAPAAEYQVKAVFLFNFAQFVEWPAQAFAGAKAPLVIGVLGADPFGAYLDELVAGEKIGERAIEVRRFARLDEAAPCHILFISSSEAAKLDKIIPRLGGRPVLSVGDADMFSRRGGMIRFVTDGGKIRMRINLQAAKAAGLEISSKLLRPAKIVTPETDD